MVSFSVLIIFRLLQPQLGYLCWLWVFIQPKEVQVSLLHMSRLAQGNPPQLEIPLDFQFLKPSNTPSIPFRSYANLRKMPSVVLSLNLGQNQGKIFQTDFFQMRNGQKDSSGYFVASNMYMEQNIEYTPLKIL